MTTNTDTDNTAHRHRSGRLLLEQAVHEAGHYTTARSVQALYPEHIKGVHVHFLTIVRRGNVDGSANARIDFPLGYPNPETDPESCSRDQAEPWVIHYLGGVAAQYLWAYLWANNRLGDEVAVLHQTAREKIWGLVKTKGRENGGGPDLDKVKRLLGGADEKPYFMKALEIVCLKWAALYRVAIALLEMRTLSGEEAGAAYDGSLGIGAGAAVINTASSSASSPAAVLIHGSLQEV